MKTLKDILYSVPIEAIAGNPHIKVTSLELDSRQVKHNSLFAALRGTQTDGHEHIPDAIRKGAIAVLCEEMPAVRHAEVTYVVVKKAAQALGTVAANYYDHPSSKIQLIGITGTNGKTTTATLCYELFTALGYACGLISTIRILIADQALPTQLTTPDVITLNKVLKQMVTAGVAYVFMEASSQGIVQRRVAGLQFSGAVFTNLTREHLDYHKTFAHYRDAKKALFDLLPKRAFALFNSDDKNGAVMVQNTRAKTYTYALRREADFKGKILENSFSGMSLSLETKPFFSLLVGIFNAYNLLAVYGIARLLGQDQLEVLQAMSLLRPPKGRFQHFQSDTGVHVLIDYAHTPDALSKVLQTIEGIRTPKQKIITLLGCGGNRDRTKRPEMARIAAEYSDEVILTLDNPRYEDPQRIFKDMQGGIPADLTTRARTVPDRKGAIRTACEIAAAGDVVLLAGKGHETYKEIRGVRYLFDELQILMDSLKEFKK